ncbi:MAG: Asp-tRNA(Asn)/Glu-tRNA(Gln) amidotransferase subunit GatC [Phycisphaeraceae bacterium]|nr:Asp-tRNA(Asn)/Glu-tRNA(Gln) amidotransferase subunit GatC [Phycisphaeraceae bacterium]
MSQRVSDEEVRHAAMLSRLKLTDEQIHHFAVQLSDIVGYVDKLAELDVEGVEPMAHAAELTNVLREDVPQGGLTVEQALANSPETYEGHFRVIKVLGEGSGA